MKQAVVQDGRAEAAHVHGISVGTPRVVLPRSPKFLTHLSPEAVTPSPTTASPAATLSEQVPPAVALSATPDALRVSAEARPDSQAANTARAAAKPAALDDHKHTAHTTGAHSAPRMRTPGSPTAAVQKPTAFRVGDLPATELSGDNRTSATLPAPQRDKTGHPTSTEPGAEHVPSHASSDRLIPPAKRSPHATANCQAVSGIEARPFLSNTSKGVAAGMEAPDPVGVRGLSDDYRKQREGCVIDDIAEKLGLVPPPPAGQRLPCSVHLPGGITEGALVVNSAGGDATQTDSFVQSCGLD